MYGDSQSLCSDSGSKFPPSSEAKKQVMFSREIFMDSHSTDYHDRNQKSSGLSKFFSHGVGKIGNNSNGLCSRFNLGGGNGSLEEISSNGSIRGFAVLHSQLNNDNMDHHGQTSLMRQNSSPAGLFSHLTPQNGYYAPLRGGYVVGNGIDGASIPSSSRLNRQMSYSSSLPSSLGILSQTTEAENNEKRGNDNSENEFYGSEFPFSSWIDSAVFTEANTFAANMVGDLGCHPQILSHHLSLPKTSAAVEKFWQLQETIPCKIRAKRGCATHPRSIAERVRRTRISERMRKLQELVPHMDKQTNTADMLDLAVEYIKNLQNQYKSLDENRANCKCLAKQKPVSNRRV